MKHSFLYTALFILLVGTFLRIWRLPQADLWLDEVMSLRRGTVPMSQVWQETVWVGNHVPLYFVSLHLWDVSNELALRFSAALMGILGIAILMAITRSLYRDDRLALWVGALLAFNPYHIWLSRNARPYAMLFVMVALASYFFLRIYKPAPSSRRWDWLGFIIFSMAAYLTHYAAAILPIVQFVMILLAGRWTLRFLLGWMGAQAVASLPLFAWIVYYIQQEQKYFDVTWIRDPRLSDVPITIGNMTLGFNGTWGWYLLPALIVVGIGLLLGLVYRVRQRHLPTLYWSVLLILPLTVILLLARYQSFYVDRYFMIFLPALLILIVLGWARLLPATIFRIAAALVLITQLANVLMTLENGDYERSDWRGAMDYLMHNAQPGDEVLLAGPAGPFYHYLPDQHPFIVAAEEKAATRISSVLEGANEMSDRVWVIYGNPIDDIHRMGVMPDFDPLDTSREDPVSIWLNEQTILSRKKFNGLELLLVELK